MSNYWNTPGVPHKGWTLDVVIDVREGGIPAWEAPYETCMMCGREQIRFVHIVSHPEIDEDFRVGCSCAVKMTEDYITPKALEQELRNKDQRRQKWLAKEWKINDNGNYYLRYQERYL